MSTTSIFCSLTLALILVTDGVHGQRRRGWSFMTSCGNSTSLENVNNYGHFCLSIFTTWHRDHENSFNNYRQRDNRMRFQDTTQFWNDICRWNWAVGKCFDSMLPQCSPGVGKELLDNPEFMETITRRVESVRTLYTDTLLGFHRRTCEGEMVTADIKQRIEDSNLDVNTTCLNSTQQTELITCLRILQEEDFNTLLYDTSSTTRARFNRFAESSVNCMFSEINRSPCNQATKRVMYHVAKLQIPILIDERDLNLDESTTADFSTNLRCTIGVYGDPHLRMCSEPGLTTCSAPGPQILIANGWFIVYGENKRIGRGGSPPATSLRSIQIIFQSLDTTRTVAIYNGQNGHLPVVFDGTNDNVAGQNEDKVTLVIRGSRREFIQQSTGMILALRQWSGNYFFTLRVAELVVKRSYGLLATGCPQDQIIKRSIWQRNQSVRRRRAVTQDGCEMACNETTTDESFRDICAFDCMATGTIEFGVNMTANVVVDTEEVESRDEEIRSAAVSNNPPPTTTETPSSASHTASHGVLISVITCVLVWALHTHTQWH